MNRILARAANLIDRIRKLFSRVFDTVDSVIDEFSAVLDVQGPVILEYVYTTAVKLERAIPSHGFGSAKLAMFDAVLADQVIPLVEKLRGSRLSTAAKKALSEHAKKKLAEFVAERNESGDWLDYIADLNKLELELGISKS